MRHDENAKSTQDGNSTANEPGMPGLGTGFAFGEKAGSVAPLRKNSTQTPARSKCQQETNDTVSCEVTGPIGIIGIIKIMGTGIMGKGLAGNTGSLGWICQGVGNCWTLALARPKIFSVVTAKW